MSEALGLWSRGFLDQIERLIQSHLADLPDREAVLAPLIGRVILLDLTPPGRSLFVCPVPNGIQLLTELSGTPDLTLKGSPLTFLKVALKEGDESAIRYSGLSIEGDLALARALAGLSRALNIDWQRVLSRALGERLASDALDRLRAGRRWLSGSMTSLERDLGDYLREETRWLPDATETEAFLNAVDQLNAETDRLEARLRRLESSLNPSPKTP